jgi:hypothetical protein
MPAALNTPLVWTKHDMTETGRGRQICSAYSNAHRIVEDGAAAGLVAEAAQLPCASHLSTHCADCDNAL